MTKEKQVIKCKHINFSSGGSFKAYEKTEDPNVYHSELTIPIGSVTHLRIVNESYAEVETAHYIYEYDANERDGTSGEHVFDSRANMKFLESRFREQLNENHNR